MSSSCRHGASVEPAPALWKAFAVPAFAIFMSALVAAVALIAARRLLSSAEVRAALDCAPSRLAFFDRQDRLKFWNADYAVLLSHYGLRAKKGLRLERILQGAVDAGLPAEIAQAAFRPLEAGETRKLPQFLGATGRWLQVQMKSAATGGRMVVMADVSDEVELIKSEAEARAAAEAASLAKSAYLAFMSHEIRTPLNGLLGMVQVMAANELNDGQQRRLGIVERSGRNLLSVLNDILDLSKIEAGKLVRESHVFQLRELLMAVTEPLVEAAGLNSVSVEMEMEHGLEGCWEGDSAKIRQVLTNLLSNALKFTSDGKVVLACRSAPDGVAFEVRDTGAGISTDRLDSIFENFTQAEASTARRFGGTGLGLTICRDLVDFMGGTLTVSSVAGRGSTFAFTLGLVRAEARAAADEAQTPIDVERPVHILVAEDNATNRLILAAMLEQLDVRLTLVEDGRAAVEAFTAGAFDVVLLDTNMPIMGGVQAAREMRRLEAEQALMRTPILAMTADVMRQQTEAYAAAGMDDVVAKPIELSALLQAINTALTTVGVAT